MQGEMAEGEGILPRTSTVAGPVSFYVCFRVAGFCFTLLLSRQDAIEGSSLVLLAPKIFTLIIS